MQNEKCKIFYFSTFSSENWGGDFSEWNIRGNREFNEFREFSGLSNLAKLPNFSNFSFE